MKRPLVMFLGLGAVGLIITHVVGAAPAAGRVTVSDRSAPAVPVRCELPRPTVLADSSSTRESAVLLQRYVIVERGEWESTRDPAGTDWGDARRAMLALARTTEPIALLLGFPTPNNRLVASHAREWLAPATCLEKALLAAQHRRVAFSARPTEFVAFVLRRPGTQERRIWTYSTHQNGIGRMTPLTDAMQPDLDAGWRIAYNLHNHPFAADTARWHGIPGPSASDAQFYQNFVTHTALPEARVTNGFSTVRIPASAFAKLIRSDEPVPAP